MTRSKSPWFPLIAVFGFVSTMLSGAPGAYAGSISISGTPTVQTTGTVQTTANTVTFANISLTQTKIFGTASFISNGAGGGTITVATGGLLSATVGEIFNLDYDFTLSLTGGSLTYALTGNIYVPFPPIGTIPFQVFNETGGPTTTGQQFNDSASTTNTFGTFNDIAWDGTLTVTWSDAADGDTLTVDIPNNSIDFAVVPEPSSLALFVLGGLVLLRRRRG